MGVGAPGSFQDSLPGYRRDRLAARPPLPDLGLPDRYTLHSLAVDGGEAHGQDPVAFLSPAWQDAQ